MTDKSITDSARKLANSVETDVSIVRDMIPGAPASQDVLEVCLTQASLEAKK
jgi:archaellum component FlaG (FlaF/FlaG flagellin family)